ncbi:bifunctional oligoribonuclease/PAP phosphatase NrnA [Halostella sp. JP-L12]|uniref:DHH family phosphoesterase n=1 Tax=Halostella TaxID=1843185 RepID=UPI000EF7DB96|nr:MULTISPECIES: DHH family phosphoesterase [Halostella]NHN47453.1 bifunctional oligoribonuclease/PAP phosphatase NrnA [Halostella sp. JP-L12]
MWPSTRPFTFHEGVEAWTASLEPVEIVLIGLGGIALLLGIGVALRWLRRSPGERFRRLLSNRDEVAVLMHPNPDPDAMSSAMAVAAIAESVDTDATLQYPGEIRHQENRAFQTVLGLDFERIETAADLVADEVVLVDHNAPRGFEGASSVEPTAVVDHHPGNGRGDDFTDVRTDYGACATILTEYLRSLGASPNSSGDESTPALTDEVATGLLYGVQSDTNRLTKGCSSAEFDACAFLYPGVDQAVLDRIANPQVSAGVLETKARAINDREVRGSFAVSDVGDVPVVDAIPQAADELTSLEGVTAVVVYGEYEGTLHLSGRSRDDRVHMGEALRAVVEDIPMANAGGHARMGGGQVSVEHMQGIGPSDGVSREEFTDRLFGALDGDV